MDPPWIDGPSHWGDPKYEERIMEVQEREDRREALAHAVKNRLENASTPEDIVKAAEKYLEFLKGEDGNNDK